MSGLTNGGMSMYGSLLPIHKKVSLLCFLLFLCFGFTACISDEERHEEENVILKSDSPQYYMSLNSAATEEGYYYITGCGVSSDDLKYLYLGNGYSEYPQCSNLDCEHTDNTCEAHILVENIVSDAIWYYKNRLYMIERTDANDCIISYDSKGQNRQTHAVLSVDGANVCEASETTNICFNEGYVYYFVIVEEHYQLYRLSVTADSVPELIKQYDYDTDLLTFKLSAMPGKVYINSVIKNPMTNINTYCLECCDTQESRLEEIFQTDGGTKTENGLIIEWDRQTVFDENNHMYYVTVTDTEYIINRMNLDTGKTDKFYAITGNMADFYEQQSAGNMCYMQLHSFDGKYFYVSQRVQYGKENFLSALIAYGAGKSLNTQSNMNYIYVLDMSGNCVNVFPFRINSANGNTNEIALNISFLCGDSRYLMISVDSENIAGLELTNAKYLDKLNNIHSENGVHKSIQLALDKVMIEEMVYSWKNLTNLQYRSSKGYVQGYPQGRKTDP